MPDVDQPPVYVHLPAGAEPLTIAPQPCRIVVVIEQEVSSEWQARISKWIVDTGCLYMMAWGTGCSAWHDAVDIAHLEDNDWGEIPDNRFMMTTWHDDEPLEEVFWFCRFSAYHSDIELPTVIIVHIAETPRREEILEIYCKDLDEE
jgi:hypothetical protein